MLNKIKKGIQAFLGVDSLSSKTEISAAQIKNLQDAFGIETINKFFDALEKETNSANNQTTIDELNLELTSKNEENTRLKASLKQLASMGDQGTPPAGNNSNAHRAVASLGYNPKAVHNIVAAANLNGQDYVTAGTTIDVDELKSEFGTFLSQNTTRLEVIKKLTQPTESEKYMTTKMAIEEWRASSALITSVVQQFKSKWTPLGQAKFTPLVIKNYRHKINVPITPDEIMGSWLAYLYDESLEPKDMPITKYIINELVVPKALEDRELRLIATGVFEEISGTVSDGDAGQDTGKSMNGFITILRNEKTSGTSKVNFIELGELTDENIVDKMNEFVDAIDDLYQNKDMPVFVSRTRYKQYKRAYKKLYGSDSGDPNFGQDIIDYSNNRLVVLPSMAGVPEFFTTPKDNFIRLRHTNTGASKIFLQQDNYDVKVFAEWWEGVGFAIAEAVFAYVPDQSSASASVSASASA